MRIGTNFLFKLFPLYNLEDHHHALADAEACALMPGTSPLAGRIWGIFSFHSLVFLSNILRNQKKYVT